MLAARDNCRFSPIADIRGWCQVTHAMRIVFGLMFALIGVLLIVDFKQVSRDSKAAPLLGYSNLTGALSPLRSQIAGVCCVAAAFLFWFA